MIFVDSSALFKRYIDEPGSTFVAQVMAEDPHWSASVLARTESQISLCRRSPDPEVRAERLGRLSDEWPYVLAVPIDADCLARAQAIGCAHRVRTLDAIHLASALAVPGDLTFLTFDRRQGQAAVALGLPVIEMGEQWA